MRTHAPVTLLGDALPLALDDEVAEVLQIFGKTHQRGGGFFLKFSTVGGVYQGGAFLGVESSHARENAPVKF